MQEMQVQSLGREDPLEEEMATHSSIPAWKIPHTEGPGGQQFMGLQRVRHDWAHTSLQGHHPSHRTIFFMCVFTSCKNIYLYILRVRRWIMFMGYYHAYYRNIVSQCITDTYECFLLPELPLLAAEDKFLKWKWKLNLNNWNNFIKGIRNYESETIICIAQAHLVLYVFWLVSPET